MANRQEMLNGMGLPDLPSQSELWKDEKSKYRPFIIMFGVGMLIVFALLLSSFIVNVTTSGIQSTVADRLYTMYRTSYDSNDGIAQLQAASDAARWYNQYVIAYPIVSFALLGIGALLYGVSLYDSYTKKTFAKLSGYATGVVLIGAIFSVFQLLQMAWSPTAKLVTEFSGGIFQIVAYALVIALSMLGSQVTKIKRMFLMSARIEMLKSDPAFMNAQQQMMGAPFQGAFGPTLNPQAPPAQPTQYDENGKPIVPMVMSEQTSQARDRLQRMTYTNLKKVASRLYISGVEEMSKDELIDAIIRVTDDQKS